LFCGGGGGSHAAVSACKDLDLEIQTFIAINHDPTAIATHEANHPWARHFCQDVASVRPIEAVPSGRVHLLLAGPECTFHSNAAGERPINDQSRQGAFSVLDWLNDLYVDTVVIENVPEFMKWGPLNADRSRNKQKMGQTFIQYIEAIKALGYNVEYRVLCAADYGDPTSRERLFILAKRRGKVVWPEPTHCDPRKLKAQKKQINMFNIGHDLKPWRTAREIIDWSIPGESIFGRKKPLSPNTMKRIFAGLKKFGLRNFVLPDEGVFRGNAARGVDSPLPTVVAGKGAGHLVQPFIIKQYGTNDAASVNGPLPTVTANGTHLGLAEPVLFDLSAFMVNAGGPEVAPRSVDEPMHTVLTRDHMAFVQAFMLGQQSQARPRSVDEPVPTVATAGAISLVEPYIVGFGGPEGSARPKSVDQPLTTVLTDNRLGLIEPFILNNHGGKDCYLRGASVDDPFQTLTTIPAMYLVEPFVMPVSHGARDTRTHTVDGPLPTITGVHNLGIVEPFMLAIDQTGSRSDQTRSLDMPIGAVTTKNRLALVQPYMVAYHGTAYPGGERVRHLEQPFPTVGAGGNQFGLVEPFIVQFNGTSLANSVDQPLGTVTTKDRFALCVPLLRLATADGIRIGCILLDIRFRMFEPHELAAAMSFPSDYKWRSAKPSKRKLITKRENVKLIGNAWPGEVGRALCRALLAS
jgi:DNA (cytosine-5)-methyltransferase 1